MNNVIEKIIELSAPAEKVWRAITDHKAFGEWFRVELEGPFAVGETARGRMTYPGYEHVVWNANVVAIEPQTLFAFTWRPYALDPNVDYSSEEPTRVEFRLEPTATGTRLTVIESGFDRVPAQRRDEAFRMNDKGWTQQMKNIQTYVGG